MRLHGLPRTETFILKNMKCALLNLTWAWARQAITLHAIETGTAMEGGCQASPHHSAEACVQHGVEAGA